MKMTYDEMRELSAIQRDMISLIARHVDPSGAKINRELHGQGHQLTHATIYDNLDELVDRELVEKGEKDSRTNYYALTERGRNVAIADLEWRAECLGVVLNER